jgi:branched-chain amino acid aminotransferase
MKDRGIDVIEKNLPIDEVIKAHESGDLKEVFGTGTAAVVSLVHKISYKDSVIELNPDQYEIAPSLKQYIDGMRVGTIEDKFGWTERVEEAVIS